MLKLKKWIYPRKYPYVRDGLKIESGDKMGKALCYTLNSDIWIGLNET